MISSSGETPPIAVPAIEIILVEAYPDPPRMTSTSVITPVSFLETEKVASVPTPEASPSKLVYELFASV